MILRVINFSNNSRNKIKKDFELEQNTKIYINKNIDYRILIEEMLSFFHPGFREIINNIVINIDKQKEGEKRLGEYIKRGIGSRFG